MNPITVDIGPALTGGEIFSIIIAVVLLVGIFAGGEVIEHFQAKKYGAK